MHPGFQEEHPKCVIVGTEGSIAGRKNNGVGAKMLRLESLSRFRDWIGKK